MASTRMQRLLRSSNARRVGFAAWTAGAIGLGYHAKSVGDEVNGRQLPSGWRACCDGKVLTPAHHALVPKLASIVGAANVRANVEQKGSRLGHGEAFAVVRPGTIQEAVDCLQACVDSDTCVIPQGANTGLTGGSVPRDNIDRPTVVINMMRLSNIVPIDDGQRMVS